MYNIPLHTANHKVLSSLDILNVEDRIRLDHVYNIYHGSAHSYLHENFTLKISVSVQNTNLSFNEDLLIPRVKACPVDTFFIMALKTDILLSHIKCTNGKNNTKIPI